MTTSVAIAGGGIAGVSTAAALRSGGFDGEITLIDAGEFPYDRPPLSKDFLTGAKTLHDIALQPPGWYDDNKVRLIGHRTVTALHPGSGQIELSDSTTVTADRVVLATGGHAARPPIPGSESDRVHVLRTAEDAERLRARLLPGARVLVVGAGLIGAEVASTARHSGCEVTLADPVNPPLTAAVGPLIADWLHQQHTERGILTKQTSVRSLAGDTTGIRAEFTTESGVHTFDLVVLGVGMVPDVTLAAAAGLRTDRGILVDHTATTSNPAVLAVGDAARPHHDGIPGRREEHWDAAQFDGRRAAATILGLTPPAESASWFWTDRHGAHVEVAGAMAAAENTVLRGELGSARFAVFGLAGDRVVGAVSVGDSTAVRAARRLIDRATTVDPRQLADPSIDLKRLARG